MIVNWAVQSFIRIFFYNAILFIDISNNAQYKPLHSLTRKHSSRMRTIRCSGCWGGGVCLPRGVSAPVHAGIPARGAVSVPVYAGIHPPCGQNS